MSLSLTLNTADVAHFYKPDLSQLKPDIADYLEMMMLEYDAGDDQCLFLPSLMSLSECFQCSAVEVHQTLCELKARGCDFFIMGFESPITLWYPTRLV